MERLSVVLVTYNEERNIDRCLGSMSWADEIVVVDSFSTDRTLELARKYTTKIHQHEYPGTSKQVERGIGYATGDWIFVIDADEEISPELRAEVEQVLRHGTDCAGYTFIRKPKAFGQWIEHGGWFPDVQFRFFRRDSYYPEHQEIHGGFNTKGKKGALKGYLYHHTYETIYAYVEKMNEYTSLHVNNKLKDNARIEVPWHKVLLSPLSHFLRMFISRKGYKDGFHGFVLALLDANYAMLLYAKLWEYRMRQRDGSGVLPPTTNAELNVLKKKNA
ncbi:(heptosyl)LPS beta-1,4-glucosyltransferase [Anaerolineae bacterium]|nr:(heptosyl)LPS beta-1,4-glucosyltransferase [Anaerolineae bacterium]